MKQFTLDPVPFEKDQIKRILDENDVLINHNAEEYFSHPDFMTDQTETVHIVITSLHEIGLKTEHPYRRFLIRSQKLV